MELTTEQLALLPSDRDVEFYREHGYFVSASIFSDAEIADALYGCERFYAGERDYSLPAAIKSFEGWTPAHGNGLRQNDYVSLQNEELSVLVRHPLIGAIAARLAETREIRLWHDQLIYKPPADSGAKTAIGWHTDRSYWQTCTSGEMLTAWIALQDYDEELSPLVFLDGSHRWVDQRVEREFHNPDLRAQEQKIVSGGHEMRQVKMLLKKGQVSFHHCRLIHGSGPNLAAVPRMSLSVHLQDEANEYREYRRHGELVWHHNDLLCRKVNGRPDYRDPDFCPVLFRETGAPGHDARPAGDAAPTQQPLGA